MACSSTATFPAATMLRSMWSGNFRRIACPRPTMKLSLAASSMPRRCPRKPREGRGCGSRKFSTARRELARGSRPAAVDWTKGQFRMSYDGKTMKILKTITGVVLLLALASNIWSISRWNESRGVYDDVCYLRQAHLFQRFGLHGIDTDIRRDDDHYLANKLKEIGYAAWSDPANAPCHSSLPALKKHVMQYPPGTGFVLAAFPAGFQVIPLYMLASIVTFGFALLALLRASTLYSILLSAAFGDVAIYLMINPTKASYSM